MRAYAGIGSRKTPEWVLSLFEAIAGELGSWCLRSGGAPGADQAFELGARGHMNVTEVFLPWPGFEGKDSSQSDEFTTYYDLPTQGAYELSALYHPAWFSLKPSSRALHARNAHQVLGIDLASPVDMVICWTPGASGGGGTGQALRIAKDYGIPIVDFGFLQ